MNEDVFVVAEHFQGAVADITYVMLAAGRALVDGTGGSLTAVLLGLDAAALASSLAADRVVYVDDAQLAAFSPEAYVRVLSKVVSEAHPRAVLFGDTSIGAEVAGALSIRLGAPVISACRTFRRDGDDVMVVSQSYGGKVTVESALPGEMTLLLMAPGGYKPEAGRASVAPPVAAVASPGLDGLRVTHERYIEPEAGDVDIAKAPILVAVGRGIQQEDNIELAQELADALGGAVCASRPIVDQGWLAASRLVGKSGHVVSPKLYLALGISGAPEHTEGIGGSETIVAVNTDPAAPIFEVARYGVEADLFDLLPVLTEAVRTARQA